MAYRDRTALFLRYRAEARALHGARSAEAHFNKPSPTLAAASSSSRVLTAGSGEGLREGGGGEGTAALHAALSADVAAARAALADLRAGYATHLLPRFGDAATGALELRVRRQAHALTALLHGAEARVRALGAPAATAADADVRRNMQRRFAAAVQAISAEFRARQKEYLESLRRQQSALDGGGGGGGGGGDASAFALADARDADADGFGDADVGAQLLDTRRVDTAAAEREAELKAVTENIGDLAMLVKDLAALVVDQGTLLDRIDYNLEDVEETTAGAVHELRVAERYQRRRHGLCCIVILAAACGVMLILLVLRWTA